MSVRASLAASWYAYSCPSAPGKTAALPSTALELSRGSPVSSVHTRAPPDASSRDREPSCALTSTWSAHLRSAGPSAAHGFNICPPAVSLASRRGLRRGSPGSQGAHAEGLRL